MKILEIYYKYFDQLDISLKISIQILLIVLFTFLLSKVIKYVLFLLFKYATKTTNNLNSAFIVAAKKPLMFFIWLYSFVIVFDLATLKLSEENMRIALNAKYVIVYLLILNFLLKSVSQIRKNYILQKEKTNVIFDHAGIDALEKLSKVFIIIIWSIFALQRLGVNLSALLAFGGAGGVLLGLAGRDMFSNIIGGLTIYINKPFAVGDWISSPDRQIEGMVETIDWMQTTILAFDKYPIYVPNSTFGNIVIENRGRIKAFRVKEEIKIRYVDLEKIEKIMSEISKMLKEHPSINKKYRIYSNFLGITDGIIRIFVAAFTNTTEYGRFFDIKQDVLLKIANIIKENGAENASPITTLKMDKINHAEQVIENVDEIEINDEKEY